jgi:hypothetical protein
MTRPRQQCKQTAAGAAAARHARVALGGWTLSIKVFCVSLPGAATGPAVRYGACHCLLAGMQHAFNLSKHG